MADIMHLLRIRAAPERVYTALATPEGARSCGRPKQTSTFMSAASESSGSTAEMKITRVRIEALEPPSRIVWRTTESFRPEWADTVITFRIRPSPEGATLLFSHGGFPDADEDYALCTTGWAIYLTRLQQVAET